ncbi:MAG: putative sulfate exporter family transporter [bacterium]
MSGPTSLEKRRWYSGMLTTEDWWSVWVGLLFFALGLLSLTGVDLVGWIAYPSKWVGLTGDNGMLSSVSPLGEWYQEQNLGMWSILVSYAVFTIPVTIGALAMKWDLKKFIIGWTFIFFFTYGLWIIGHHAFLAADTTNKAKYGLDHSLSLGGGASYILALGVGLLIGNLIKPLARFLSEAAKPEWFIKTAIVFLGVKVGYMALDFPRDVFELALAGAAATIVAYLIFWPGTYLISRKLFNLPRKTAAVLSSAISICGVSAAVATGGAVRSKPIVPVMVSALVVVYAVIELVVLPPIFTKYMIDQPVVAGSALGMSVKTDGADAAAGAVMDDMMRIKKRNQDGVEWVEGFITTSAVMTKIWIDMFIGLWAFLLAMVWVYKIDRVEGEKVPVIEIWHRFPKFVLGYFCTWFAYLGLLVLLPDAKAAAAEASNSIKDYHELAKMGAMPVEKGMRKLFFMLTFVSIGIMTDFKKLAEARFGRMVGVYFVALFLFVIPVALIVAWIFHHGMTVPVAGQ